jgi:hypothetical protein
MLLVIAGLAGLLSSAAVAAHKKTESLALLEEARMETQAIGSIIEDSAPRRVERRLMRRLNRLEDLLDSLEGEILNQERRRPSRVNQDDGFSGMLIVEDLADVPVDLPMRQVDPDDFFYDGQRTTSSKEMAKILKALEAEAFSDGRLSALGSAMTERSFTVAQVKAVLKVFPFGDDKVEAAALLFSQVSDQQNWFEIYAELDFDSDREALRTRVGI